MSRPLSGRALAAKGIRRGATTRLRTSRIQLVDTQGVVLARDGYSCVRCGGRVQQCHHRRPRQMGGASRSTIVHTSSNVIAVCAADHTWIESNREEATALGYLVPMGLEPTEWPVFWRNQWVYLTNTGTVMHTTKPERLSQ